MVHPVENQLYVNAPKSIDYATDGTNWWMLRSVGPDGIPQIRLESARLEAGEFHLAEGTFDPTNGIRSSGDIWRTNLEEWDRQ